MGNKNRNLKFQYPHDNITLLCNNQSLKTKKFDSKNSSSTASLNLNKFIKGETNNTNFLDKIEFKCKEEYYNYYFRDGRIDSNRIETRDKHSQTLRNRYGLDNGQFDSFFRNIKIYQLTKQTWFSYTLVNPMLTNWGHDSLDYSDGSGIMSNSMSVAYESVVYNNGNIDDEPLNFTDAETGYDNTPSPISAGSSSSLFGSAGILAGGTSVLGDIAGGKADLGTLLTAARTVKNAKDLTKEGIRNEAFQVAGQTIRTATGTNVSGLANTSFPKSGGNGTQTTEAKAITTVKQNKQIDTAELQTALANNAELKDLVAERAVAIGAVSTLAGYNIGNAAGLGAYDNLTVNEKTIVKTEVDQLLSNEDPKMLSITNSIVTKYRESQTGSSTIAAQKNPLGNV